MFQGTEVVHAISISIREQFSLKSEHEVRKLVPYLALLGDVVNTVPERRG